MATTNSSSAQNKRVGDTAVNGLIGGIIAGLVMALVLLAAGFLNGESPAVVLQRFDPAQANNWLVGLLTHLAVSAVYGLVFGLIALGLLRIRPSLARFSWLMGLIYGLVLYGIARAAFLSGVNSGLAQFTAVYLFVSHAVYGLVLGFIIGRQE
ncbi:MAG TPA: hypothetical protein ENK32_01335 [Anaerolineae bacterium]|nr:hypothetical protein [Anaerolineae bacterium]